MFSYVFLPVFKGGLMGPVRMISSGHELTTDYDEKALHELGFKDMQVTHKCGFSFNHLLTVNRIAEDIIQKEFLQFLLY